MDRPPLLIVLIGPPGTGKTHVGTRLARRLGARLIQTDAIRKEQFSHPTYSAEESAAVYLEAHRRVGAALKAGHSTIFDATNLQESGRRVLYRLAEAAGADLLLLWFWTPEPMVARRLGRRQSTRDPEDLSDATWTVYRRLAATAEPPRRPFTVLNGTLSAEELAAVAERLARLSSSRFIPTPTPPPRGAGDSG